VLALLFAADPDRIAVHPGTFVRWPQIITIPHAIDGLFSVLDCLPLAISVNIRRAYELRLSLSLSGQAMMGTYPTPASQVADIVV
jgi:hypothetical protein